ncbi:anthranilate synthase component I [Propionigenium maris DSM 9537]|uniref:Anthranilate synthase component 1 n=1 Tax=Propionigenium maris DSM 9537 TaxID=1123000 RepID=A0A9W6LML9_9FUSO|nr:chorismate-binding protein [Propionigenium maris]GLI55954.1 anthranilate synthase component I [Propionigenium maris DSM 9537]
MKNVFYRDINTQLKAEEAYLRLTRGEKGVLFETTEADTGYTFICCDPYDSISGNRGVIERVREALAKDVVKGKRRPYVGGAYGSIAYDTIRDYEKLPEENVSELGIDDTTMLLTERGMVYDHNTGEVYLTVVASSQKEAFETFDTMLEKLAEEYVLVEEEVVNGGYTATPSREKFIENVHRAKEYIKAGDIFQVVISQRFTQESSMAPFDFYRRLKAVNPSPYMFFLDFGGHQIIGSSPERMISLDGGKIKTVPIAGTRRRGETPEEDEKLARELLADEKERAEHRMLVDLARNDVGRVSVTGSVEVTELMAVKRFSHVMHLVSLVEGECSPEEDAYSVLTSALPAGTLSGAPKIRAMEIIEELEDSRRGFYGGAVGYINYHGEMDTCIAIRTALHREGRYTYQAGAGIVADSVPESEYRECLNKGLSIKKVFSEVE